MGENTSTAPEKIVVLRAAEAGTPIATFAEQQLVQIPQPPMRVLWTTDSLLAMMGVGLGLFPRP